MHLPLSHHNTLFKLDTAGRLFFLAEFIEPVQPDLPYQSVKGVFHSLQCETQLPSVFEEHTGGPLNRQGVCVCVWCSSGSWASSATETETSPHSWHSPPPRSLKPASTCLRELRGGHPALKLAANHSGGGSSRVC